MPSLKRAKKISKPEDMRKQLLTLFPFTEFDKAPN